jgi:hypothetical protein
VPPSLKGGATIKLEQHQKRNLECFLCVLCRFASLRERLLLSRKLLRPRTACQKTLIRPARLADKRSGGVWGALRGGRKVPSTAVGLEFLHSWRGVPRTGPPAWHPRPHARLADRQVNCDIETLRPQAGPTPFGALETRPCEAVHNNFRVARDTTRIRSPPPRRECFRLISSTIRSSVWIYSSPNSSFSVLSNHLHNRTVNPAGF